MIHDFSQTAPVVQWPNEPIIYNFTVNKGTTNSTFQTYNILPASRFGHSDRKHLGSPYQVKYHLQKEWSSESQPNEIITVLDKIPKLKVTTR